MNALALDLWLGDAQEVFPVIAKTAPVNAWFLDGFAPACNPDMWQETGLNPIVALSDYGTTFASLSVAGVLKRGLKQHGIQITRPRGFGHKREMLKAIWQAPGNRANIQSERNSNYTTIPQCKQPTAPYCDRRRRNCRFKLCVGICTTWASSHALRSNSAPCRWFRQSLGILKPKTLLSSSKCRSLNDAGMAICLESLCRIQGISSVADSSTGT